VLVAVLGLAELLQFDLSSWASLVGHPDRLVGAVAGAVLWLLLALTTILNLAWTRTSWLPTVGLWISGLLAVGSLALVPIHLAAGVGGVRPSLGALLALAALLIAWRGVKAAAAAEQ
jgi:hypothetical protein